jgi:uncharacterized protein
MANIGRALKAGIRAALSGPDGSRFEAAGRVVRCSHCGGEEFRSREAQLNTSGMTLLDVDWLNTSGTALVCMRCSLIQWFVKTPDQK